jgi:hypothetical protein
MSTTETTETLDQALLRKPKRADARRNYEKVVAAAREAFAERGDATSLETSSAGSGPRRPCSSSTSNGDAIRAASHQLVLRSAENERGVYPHIAPAGEPCCPHAVAQACRVVRAK